MIPNSDSKFRVLEDNADAWVATVGHVSSRGCLRSCKKDGQHTCRSGRGLYLGLL